MKWVYLAWQTDGTGQRFQGKVISSVSSRLFPALRTSGSIGTHYSTVEYSRGNRHKVPRYLGTGHKALGNSGDQGAKVPYLT